jgi:hypothetical protein
MNFLDPQHPFFRPLWRRVVIVLGTALWAGFEAMNGETAWALAFAAVALYCAWQFFVAFKPGTDGTPGQGEKD